MNIKVTGFLKEEIKKAVSEYETDHGITVNEINVIAYDNWICIEINNIDLIRILELKD